MTKIIKLLLMPIFSGSPGGTFLTIDCSKNCNRDNLVYIPNITIFDQIKG